MNIKKTTINQKTIALVVAGILLASFMGAMGMMTQTSTTTYAQSGEKNVSIFNWQTNRCFSTTTCSNMRDITNNVQKGTLDILLMHFGNTGATQTQIDNAVAAMHGVDGIVNARKGFEFQCLAHLEQWAPTIAQEFGTNALLGYNLETASCGTEEDTPVGSTQAAKSIAVENGLRLFMAPSHFITHGSASDDIVQKTYWYNMQMQQHQDDQPECSTLASEAAERVSFFESADAGSEGEISYQLSFAQSPAEGKTIVETIKDCMDAVTPGDVDGVVVWFNSAAIDNGTWEEVMAYHEDNYSS
jgi:hypothetical protein